MLTHAVIAGSLRLALRAFPSQTFSLTAGVIAILVITPSQCGFNLAWLTDAKSRSRHTGRSELSRVFLVSLVLDCGRRSPRFSRCVAPRTVMLLLYSGKGGVLVWYSHCCHRACEAAVTMQVHGVPNPPSFHLRELNLLLSCVSLFTYLCLTVYLVVCLSSKLFCISKAGPVLLSHVINS